MYKLSIAEILIFFYSFVLGCLRFSVISFAFYFCTSTLRMSPTKAILCCHSYMASVYLTETLTGTVSKTKLGVPRTAVVLASILVCSFVFPLLWGDVLWKVSYVGVSLLMLVSALLGGLIHCLKHIFINEYNLPEQQNRYLTMKLFVVELEYIGKTLGGFLAMGTIDDEPSMLFTAASWMIFGVLQLAIAIAGLKCFQQQKNNRNIIKEFIKHSFYALKAQLENRRNESEKFSADDEERIKIVHSVLPLYLPVIILIGLKDLKYSRYVWQASQLTLNVFDVPYNPQKILILFPLTVAICLPVYHYCVQPLMKKFMSLKLRTTTRAIVSFYFMAGSLVLATVLECRIELDQKEFELNKTTRLVEVYNFLPCNVEIEASYTGATKYEVQKLNMTTIRCPIYYDYNAVLVNGVCRLRNITRYFSMTVVLNRHKDIRIGCGYDLHHSVSFVDLQTQPIFFRHFHPSHKFLSHHLKVWIVFNTAADHNVKIVPIVKNFDTWIPQGTQVFQKHLRYSRHLQVTHVDLVKNHWYGIYIDGNITEKLNYKSQNSYAIMISQFDTQSETLVKVIVQKTPSRHILYQFPQVISSALAEMLIEAPGFVYGRKKVPLQWNDFVSVVWTFCSFLGNAIIIFCSTIINVERNLTAFLIGSASSVVAIALISVFLLDYYKADYEEE